MTKARTLADFISDGSPLADGTISVSEVSGAAPLASPTFTGGIIVGDGNVGIGGTPAAWSGTARVLEFDGQAADYIGFNSATSGYIYQNAYYDGTNNVYKNTGLATAYGQAAGVHSWFGAASGTAGATAALSERMRISSSGNVGIGTAAPDTALTVSGGDIKATGSVRNQMLVIERTDSANDYQYQIAGGSSSDSQFLAIVDNKGGGAAERMRIGSGGTITLGPSGVSGVSVFPNWSAGGGLLYWNRTTTTAVTTALRFDNAGVAVGSIIYNNNSAAYNTSSDYRLKTDAQPMVGASARVQALNPVNFEWIASGDRVDGFLAHEAQSVVPECATGTKDAMMDEEYEVTAAIEATYDDDGNELTEAVDAVMGTRSVPDYQGIDQSKLVPLLTAALQEALNKIDDLETRLTALEAE